MIQHQDRSARIIDLVIAHGKRPAPVIVARHGLVNRVFAAKFRQFESKRTTLSAI